MEELNTRIERKKRLKNRLEQSKRLDLRQTGIEKRYTQDWKTGWNKEKKKNRKKQAKTALKYPLPLKN